MHPQYFRDALRGLRDECCVPYLDDALSYSKSFHKHMDHLKQMLSQMRHSIKRRPAKCEVFKRKIWYIWANGMRRRDPHRPKRCGSGDCPEGEETSHNWRGTNTTWIPELLLVLLPRLSTCKAPVRTSSEPSAGE